MKSLEIGCPCGARIKVEADMIAQHRAAFLTAHQPCLEVRSYHAEVGAKVIEATKIGGPFSVFGIEYAKAAS